ncbi:MAG: hypothetical protein FWH01_08245 [Oscillospiraceae bacterium]|nr:hypothetical protein [Oscillospiraceae bacterium]
MADRHKCADQRRYADRCWRLIGANAPIGVNALIGAGTLIGAGAEGTILYE